MTIQRVALLVDFDETAAQQNVAETLLKEFGGEGWQGFRESFRNGTMNLRHYQEQAFNEIDTPLEEMGQALVKLACLRPGFKKLYSYCKTNEIQLSIVTNVGIWSTATLMPQRNVGNGVTVSAKCCLSTVTVAQTSFLSVMVDLTSALHVRPISCLRGRRFWSIAKILGFRTRSSMTSMTYWTSLNLEYLVFGNPRYRHAKKATAPALRRIAIPIG